MLNPRNPEDTDCQSVTSSPLVYQVARGHEIQCPSCSRFAQQSSGSYLPQGRMKSSGLTQCGDFPEGKITGKGARLTLWPTSNQCSRIKVESCLPHNSSAGNLFIPVGLFSKALFSLLNNSSASISISHKWETETIGVLLFQ